MKTDSMRSESGGVWRQVMASEREEQTRCAPGTSELRGRRREREGGRREGGGGRGREGGGRE